MNPTPSIGFGLDLAGYTTGKSSLAVIEIREKIGRATVLSNSCFAKKRGTNDYLEPIVAEEVEALSECLKLGNVAVDIPIDLQNLTRPEAAKKVWQLTHRAVDKAISNKLIKKDGLAPIADRIGYPLARFQRIMDCGSFFTDLGKRLFETYPKAVLVSLGLDSERYKASKGKDKCREICERLNIKENLNDDDLDAIVCAIVAAASTEHICSNADFNLSAEEIPRGYRIIKSNPTDKILVEFEDFSTWKSRHGHP